MGHRELKRLVQGQVVAKQWSRAGSNHRILLPLVKNGSSLIADSKDLWCGGWDVKHKYL